MMGQILGRLAWSGDVKGCGRVNHMRMYVRIPCRCILTPGIPLPLVFPNRKEGCGEGGKSPELPGVQEDEAAS